MNDRDDEHLDAGMRIAFGLLRERYGSSGAAASPKQRYEVQTELGRGGMGAVYEARDCVLGRVVAVKVLHQETDHLARRRRFVEEARIASRLQHPGIVPIHDLGESGTGTPYFVMKKVEGVTLRARLAARSSLEVDRAELLQVFERLCQAVAYAHDRGVIHRDLKPENVMIGAFGEVLLMDWGLAKDLTRETRATGQEDGAESLTGDGSSSLPGTVMGTPASMAPEQARGEVDSVDRRADVFALGAILCEALTGSGPWGQGARDDVKLRAVAGDTSVACKRVIASSADPDLVSLATECLASSPEERPHDAAVVAARMTAYLLSVESRARQAEVAAAEARAHSRHERRIRRLTGTLAGVVLLVAALTTATWIMRESERRARLQDTIRLVDEALFDAVDLRARALAAPKDAARHLGEAVQAARRAQDAANAGETDAATTRRIRLRLEELQAEVLAARAAEARARRDDDMTERLDQIEREASIVQDPLRTDRELADAFGAYGIDVDSEGAAAAIRGSPIGEHLIAALDAWFLIRPEREKGYRISWPRIVEVSEAASIDPRRNRIRRAYLDHDTQALLDASTEDQLADLPPSVLSLLAEALAARGHPADALRVARHSQSRYPGNHDANMFFGIQLSRARPPDLRQAIAYFTAAVALRPDRALTWTNRAVAYRRMGDLPAALADLERALDLDSGLATIHDLLGLVLADLGRLAEAEAQARESIRLESGFARGWHNLGIILHKGNRRTEAKAAFREAIERGALLGLPWDALAQILADEGRGDDSVEASRRAIAADPGSGLFHHTLGATLYRRRDFAGAIEAMREAVRLEPDKKDHGQSLGQILRSVGHVKEALTLLEAGAADRDAPAELASWITDCRAQLAQDQEVDRVLSEDRLSVDDEAWRRLVDYCITFGQVVRESRLYGLAREHRASLLEERETRRRALDAAARAGTGRGWDVERPVATGLRALRDQALGLLREELTRIAAEVRSGGLTAPAAIRLLEGLLDAADLAPFREPFPVDEIDAKERAAWSGAWDELESLLDRLEGDGAAAPR